MKYIVLSLLTFLTGCACEPEVKFLTPIVSDKTEIGIVMSSQEALTKYTEHLSSRFIPYDIDSESPLEVWWHPYNDEHRELIWREAFGVPDNQIQVLFHTEQEAKKLLSVLAEMGVQYSTGGDSTHFVVLYFPESDEQKSEIEQVLK